MSGGYIQRLHKQLKARQQMNSNNSASAGQGATSEEMRDLLRRFSYKGSKSYYERLGKEAEELLAKPLHAPSAPAEQSDYTVDELARYIESESECLMSIVPEETRLAYGRRLLKVMADELRDKFGGHLKVAKPDRSEQE